MGNRAVSAKLFWLSIAAAVAVGGVPANARSLPLGEKLRLLVASYPDTLSHLADGKLFLRDGGPPLEIDDGKTSTFKQELAHADIQDMLEQVYPQGPCLTHPAKNFDPGRIRSEALLKRLYGATRADVARHLTHIDWFGASLAVTKAQGVDKALAEVRDEIARLPLKKRRPAMKSAGTFNWRDIAGTHRLSVHSFGAAIDLDTKYASYWRWSGGETQRANQMPLEVVKAFERHGFIWGGRWYHYDTMHFEYRPELLAIARKSDADACGVPSSR